MLLYELDQNRTDIYFRDREVLYLFKLLILGDKRFELLKAIAIEFTAQPVIPTNGTFLHIYILVPYGLNVLPPMYIYIFIFLTLMNPVQFPLHEPYFDLTPIKVTHTKIKYKMI